MSNKKRTLADLRNEWLNMISPKLREDMEKEFPDMASSPLAQKEISEQAYQFLLRQFRRELPYFIRFVLNKKP